MRSRRPSTRGRAGFTLLEIVVAMALMSLLAGAMAPLAAGQIKGQRIRVTQERMQRVIEGMVGSPDAQSYGYLGDMGTLPRRLEDMNLRGSQPAFVADSGDGIGTGYNGPYVPMAGPKGAAFVDAWGTPFDYSQASARITSAGADRAFGTADDLIFPDEPQLATGNVSVSVTGIPNDGRTGCLLNEDEADVVLSFSKNGQRKETRLRGASEAAPFTASGLHRGYHGVRFEGRGDFAGATARDVIELRGGNAHLRVTLIQPAGAAPACRS